MDPILMGFISINPRGDKSPSHNFIPVFQFIAFWSVREGIRHLSGLQHGRTTSALQVAGNFPPGLGLGWVGQRTSLDILFLLFQALFSSLPFMLSSGPCGTPKSSLNPKSPS